MIAIAAHQCPARFLPHRNQTEERRLRATGANVFYKTLIVAMALLGLVIVGFESSRPHADAAVAVIFPPWVDAGSAGTRVAEAGGGPSSAGRYPFVAFVPESSPKFRQAVRKQGALLVLDAEKFGGMLGKSDATM
jgi:hypothetical protein